MNFFFFINYNFPYKDQVYYLQMNFYVNIIKDNILINMVIILDFKIFNMVMDFITYLMYILHYQFNFNVFIFYHNNY